MSGYDEADDVASEHLRWARGQGMTNAEVLRSIGLEIEQPGSDDVRGALAATWLEIRLPFIRPLTKAKRMGRRAA